MLDAVANFALSVSPLALAGFFLIGRRSDSAAGRISTASVQSFGSRMPAFAPVLPASIDGTFGVGGRLVAPSPESKALCALLLMGLHYGPLNRLGVRFAILAAVRLVPP